MLRSSVRRLLLNEQIFASRVRLLGPAGEFIGEMETQLALEKAREIKYNLVLIAASPPTAILSNEINLVRDSPLTAKATRFAFDPSARVKHVIFGCNIGISDFERKIEQLRGFLNMGSRCDVSLRKGATRDERAENALARRIMTQVRDVATDHSIIAYADPNPFPMRLWPRDLRGTLDLQ